MKKQLLLCELYDCYGKLLTDKQQTYFENYYFENLTLAELSINYKVSRNAIHKSLKEAEEKLEYYESILTILNKKKQLKKLITNLDDKLKEEILNLYF